MIIYRPTKQTNTTPLVVELGFTKEINPSFQVTEIQIEHFIDSPSDKKVIAIVSSIGEVVLWEGEAYDAIGDWTTQDVEDRIKEIYA